MLKRASLLCILLSFLSTTTQSWPQQSYYPNSVRIQMEGDFVREVLEALQRNSANRKVKFVYVDPGRLYDLRLIVSGGDGEAQFSGTCSNNVISPAKYWFRSIVALKPDGKLQFTVARSGAS